MSDPAPTAVDILRGARELLGAPEAWCKGNSQVVTGGRIIARDLLTALIHSGWSKGLVHTQSDRRTAPFWHAYDILTRLLAGDGWRGIHHFNDDERTEHSDILMALHAAEVRAHV